MKKIIVIFLLLMIPVSSFSVNRWKYRQISRTTMKAYNRLFRSKVIKWETIGKSVWGQPIYYKVFGKGEKSILIVGMIHGDEPAAGTVAVKLARRLAKMKNLGIRVVVIPYLNPDGLYLQTRTNVNKVDLNRNFPSPTWKKKPRKIYNYPGETPASEPETRIVVDAIKKYNPALVIQTHQPFGKIYPDPYIPDDLSKKMSEIAKMPVAYDIGYECPGSMGSYTASFKGKHGMITYELGAIDRIPPYTRIVDSIIFAINYMKNNDLKKYDKEIPYKELLKQSKMRKD